ncbi:diguanylate cyclase domain-containing protein [Halomonas sp.]|uniref:sensor domain-containing diguanylate cyclase n=1 Tax=Halomonas sp. TaxID=1486246 RepID=UPI00298D85C1|nr:diguanylate cyclase [Halomonas sp.]MDW7745227.1 diguanylate cyclase [Halomonas sp.]
MDSLRSSLDNPEDEFVLVLKEPIPAVVAVSAILRTDRSGPAQGWLAKMRSIDERFIEQIEQQTGQPLQIMPAGSIGDKPAKETLIRKGSQLIARRQLESPLMDQPLEIVTHIPRDSFRASSATFRYAVAWTAGLLVLVIALVLLLLERMILAPLRHFSRFTQKLNSTPFDKNTPCSLLERNDEIGTLAREFQKLLALQKQQADELLDLSQHDPLTGVANRRLFDDRFAQALQSRGRQPGTAAMMIDIDHFKLYNDHYGHQEGDNCLITLAQCMDQQLRSSGFLLARTGGEEFSVLLPNTTLDTALTYGDNLLEAINQLRIPHACSPTSNQVTVSIGVAVQRPGLITPGDIMRAADQALYLAKANGRNQIQAYYDQPSIQNSPLPT